MIYLEWQRPVLIRTQSPTKEENDLRSQNRTTHMKLREKESYALSVNPTESEHMQLLFFAVRKVVRIEERQREENLVPITMEQLIRDLELELERERK